MVFLMFLITCILVSGFLFIILSTLYNYTYWKRRKLPHVNVFPVFGKNASIFFRRISFPQHSQYLYGMFPEARYYGTFDFNTPTIIIKDPDLIRDICVKNFDKFPNHQSFVTEEMDPIVGRNIFSLKDDRWKEVRNTLSPSFTSNKIKIMFQLISECASDFVQYFSEHLDAAKSFEAKDVFTRYTNDVIATTAFGIQVNSMRNCENEFYLYGKDATSFSSPLRLIKFILFRCFPKLLRMTGESFMSRSTNKFFNRLITTTVKSREEKGIIRSDMIHLLIQAKHKNNGISLTIDDIIGQAFIFFLAGFDTVSTLICFTAYELAAHLNIQEKVRKEIEEQLEKENGQVTYKSIQRMKYLDMILNEILRLYPPSPIIDRVCTKELVIPSSMKGYPEYRVEVGTSVVMPVYGLHRDPKYFPDPDKFIPERFSEQNKSNINPYTYIPFGLGPRKCIGNRFALMETKILLVHILKKFIIKFTDKSKYPVVFCKKTFNMSIEGGFWIKFEEKYK